MPSRLAISRNGLETDGPFAYLPALELKNALNGVLVHAQQVAAINTHNSMQILQRYPHLRAKELIAKPDRLARLKYPRKRKWLNSPADSASK